MERPKLQVSAREQLGKGPNRRLRAQSRVPAVLYGRGTESVNLSCDRLEFDKTLAKGVNALVDLHGIPEVEGKIVLVKEVLRDPVKRTPLHCDLYAIDVNRKIQVDVSIHFVGRSRGVEMGGVLEPLMREIEVSCLPLAIPGAFEIDVSELDIGDVRHVSDIDLPEGVEILGEIDRGVVHVIEARLAIVEEEEAAEEGEVPEGEEAPEGEAPAEAAPEEGDSDK